MSFGQLFVFLLTLWVQAAAVAQTAAKSISDMQIADEDTESSKDEEEAEDSANEKESEDDKDKIRKAALDKLEKASDESIFGQASHTYECWKFLFVLQTLVWYCISTERVYGMHSFAISNMGHAMVKYVICSLYVSVVFIVLFLYSFIHCTKCSLML